MKFCDTVLYEVPALKRMFDRMGIPMLTIESDYGKGYGGGVQTRIQAFLEMVGTLSNRSGHGNERADSWVAC